MTAASHPARLILLLVFAAAAVAAAAGCGITREELADELRPVRESQRETEQQLATLQRRATQSEQEVRQELAALRTGIERDLSEMDTRYREYNETAHAFRSLYDDVDAIRSRNFGIYGNIYTMLDTMLDLYNEQVNMMRNYASRMNHVVQRIEGLMETLSEFAPDETTTDRPE